MRIYLRSIASTEKSQVIKVSMHFCNKWNEGYRFMYIPSTGAAAIFIDRLTYYHVISFTLFARSKPSSSYASATTAIDNLLNVKYNISKWSGISPVYNALL